MWPMSMFPLKLFPRHLIGEKSIEWVSGIKVIFVTERPYTTPFPDPQASSWRITDKKRLWVILQKEPKITLNLNAGTNPHAAIICQPEEREHFQQINYNNLNIKPPKSYEPKKGAKMAKPFIAPPTPPTKVTLVFTIALH